MGPGETQTLAMALRERQVNIMVGKLRVGAYRQELQGYGGGGLRGADRSSRPPPVALAHHSVVTSPFFFFFFTWGTQIRCGLERRHAQKNK